MNHTPETAELYLTHRCNLGCRYCYCDSDGSAELRRDEWLRVIDQVTALGVTEVLFSGGEALLRPDFPELVERAVQNGMRFTLATNGALLTEAMLERLLPLRESCDFVQLSVDGPEAVHDAARGHGSFASMAAALQRLQAHGFAAHGRMTLGKHNIGHLQECADAIFGDLNFDFCGMNLVSHALGQRVGLYPDIDDLRMLFREFEPVFARWPNRFLADGPWMMLQHWRRLLRECQTPSRRFRCPGDGHKLCVMPDGGVKRCPVVDLSPEGNCRTETLVEIWTRAAATPLPESENCAACPYRSFCPGCCPCEDYLCLARFVRLGGSLDELVF